MTPTVERGPRPRNRHRRAPAPRRPLLVGAAAGAVAVALGSAVLLATSRGGEPVPTAGAVSEPAADVAARRRCEEAVAAARQAVAAARPSYSHWAGHVRAELDYDAGAATLEQTRARWAATKATGDADVAAFAAAYARFDRVRGGCADGSGPPAAVPDPVMSTCRPEFAAASTAVAAGKAVVDDWAAHVEMMKGKEHTDPAQYGQRWRDMVRAAPVDLDRFARAQLELTAHVDCPRPT